MGVESEGTKQVQKRPPDDVFGLLGNEVRLEILQAMSTRPDATYSFSELYDSIDMDDSGNFNYHLSKLLGMFVQKTDDGYELRPQGMRIYQAIISGAYTDEGKVGPERIEGEFCNECTAAAEAWYDNSHFHLGCTECGKLIMHYPIPPGSFENGDTSSMVEAASTWLLRDHITAKRGVCPYCAGSVEKKLSGDESQMDPLGKRKYRGVVSYICRRCSWEFYCNPPFAMTTEPITVGFFADHGIDIFARHPWAIYPDAEETVLSENPWRVEIIYCVDDAEQRIVIDENAEILEAHSHKQPLSDDLQAE